MQGIAAPLNPGCTKARNVIIGIYIYIIYTFHTYTYSVLSKIVFGIYLFCISHMGACHNSGGRSTGRGNKKNHNSNCWTWEAGAEEWNGIERARGFLDPERSRAQILKSFCYFLSMTFPQNMFVPVGLSLLYYFCIKFEKTLDPERPPSGPQTQLIRYQRYTMQCTPFENHSQAPM